MPGDAIQLPIRRPLGLALLAGIALAFSLPPWGWWPLAFLGFAGLYRVIEEEAWRRRLLFGWIAGVGHFGISLYWMTEFTLPGGILAILFSALYIALAAYVTPAAPGWRRVVAFPAAILAVEAIRVRWPFGGVPPGGVPLGQITGALADAARVGGPLILVGLAALAGVVLAERGVGRRLIPAAFIVGLVVFGAFAPDGRPAGGTIDVALVQGGGPRGFRAVDTDPDDVYRRHLLASDRLRAPLDLVLWPEDVIDVEGDVAESDVAGELAGIARRLQTTFVAGVVEGEGTDHFRNVAVAWGSDGRIIGRYEKFHRVPFGEWIPFRSLVDRVADISAVPADAIIGHGPNVLRTPAGRLGLAISYEVFFADRGRAATKRRADLMLVPTNAASFTSSQVPTQEIAAAQLLAVTTGRTVLQAGPTGYTAIVRHDGHIESRSTLGRQQVLTGRAGLRTGRTLYARWGDGPWLLLAVAAILTARSRGRISV